MLCVCAGKFEDEGQHLQRVYPTMAKRTPARCKGDVYRCPVLWKGASPENKIERARAQWSQLCAAWLPFVADPTRRFFLEKDPDLAVGFVAGKTLLRCLRSHGANCSCTCSLSATLTARL